MFELLGEKTAADNEKPTKKKEKKEKPAGKAEVVGNFFFVLCFLLCSLICWLHVCRKRKLPWKLPQSQQKRSLIHIPYSLSPSKI